jgi:L-2-hydroxyglutarate oxidase
VSAASQSDSQHADVIVVGGGLVGLATAWRLTARRPELTVAVLEKEAGPARHQSGRNSGVLHTGVYYLPGSKKALLCRAGLRAMERFCDEHGIRRAQRGKVIVAVEEHELTRLEKVFERGRANGVDCTLVSAGRLRELEPHARGLAALHVPEAGSVDYAEVTAKLAELLVAGGQRVLFGARVLGVHANGPTAVVETERGAFETRLVVNCAGLHSDRVARAAGADPEARIVPFRGEFFALAPSKQHLCNGRISPVPDPSLPFLGPHVTRTVGGAVECGPNAVLAGAREGYERTDVNARDLYETLTWPGFPRLAARHWRSGLDEMQRSLSRDAFARACRRLVPEIEAEDLIPAPAGVRAQAVSKAGELIDDFLIRQGPCAVHVINAPSPAATASLAIGDEVAGEVEARLAR